MLEQHLPPEITIQDMEHVVAELRLELVQRVVTDPHTFLTSLSRSASPIAIRYLLARLKPQQAELETYLPPGARVWQMV